MHDKRIDNFNAYGIIIIDGASAHLKKLISCNESQSEIPWSAVHGISFC